ncbi:hypothetical protein [Microvirga splendida]|uniref:VanZ-like domain-containing protein n=1 Tax=Microvirga splendida TaxID=2795727 RepID=A0ABS0Y4A1_9HYPH|nr:hypothetical protein [Microvirga splendida]MBJ6127099.1 hypothetical protein [Microvirga splendida]
MASTYTHSSSSSSVNSGTWRMLAWVGVALQAIAFVAVWWLQRWGGLWTIGGFFILSLAFMLMKDRIPSLMSFLIVCAALLNAGGWAWNWFNQFVWYDEFIHTFTPFALVSALMYRLWTGGSIDDAPGSGSFVLKAALIGLGLGIAWEIVEMLFLNLTVVDTLIDLVMDTIGAALGGWFAGWAIRDQGANQTR